MLNIYYADMEEAVYNPNEPRDGKGYGETVVY